MATFIVVCTQNKHLFSSIPAVGFGVVIEICFTMDFFCCIFVDFSILVIEILMLLILSAEYMPGGSLYDYLHKNQNIFEISQLLKFAIDVSKGMEYLHQNNIIHRDLKTANLLMDNHNVRTYENC